MAKKVLFVEDDRFIGEMYKHALEKAGYEFTLETDGGTGMEAAKANYYDFILLDLMLPTKKGNEILTELRQTEALDPKTKVIFLTNFQQSPEERDALKSLADEYLIKADTTPSKLLALLGQMSPAE